MKKFKLKLITPLLLTLILSGCMPDSLTKFKKDPAKKASSSTASSVVDSSGNAVVFVAPTYFYYSDILTNTYNATVNTSVGTDLLAVTDGTLANPAVNANYFDSCEIVQTGDTQTRSMPTGLVFDSQDDCRIKGTPLAVTSVSTAFCSDSTYTDQATCEAAPFVWNALTSTCSNPDYQYSTQTACENGFNTWYSIGDPIPYRIKMTYHSTVGTSRYMYTTINLRVLKAITTLTYTQNERVILDVSVQPTFALSSITPLLTTNVTAGAYARATSVIDTTGTIGIAKFYDTASPNRIGLNKLVPIKVASVAPFTTNTFISKSGDSSKVGKIYKINSSTKTLYVENLSANNKYFVAGESICSNVITGICGLSYTISSINEEYYYPALSSLDNDNQFFSTRYKMSKVANIYEVGYAIKPIRPFVSSALTAANAVTYTVSPALPCSDPTDVTKCISLDSSTGEITGTFEDYLASTAFTITATNAISTKSYTIYLGAIQAPTDLSLTNKQLLTVNTTAPFKVGELIFQPIAPPLVDSIFGKITKIFDSHKMAIDNYNGNFLENTSIDNGNTFLSEKAYVIEDETCTDITYTDQTSCEAALEAWSVGPIHYNVALKLSTTGAYIPSTAGAPVYATATAGTGIGAKALVAGVFTAANDYVFLQYLTNSATTVANSKVFYEADVLDATSNVLTVLNDALKINVTSSVAFNLGVDIFSNGNASAYTYKKGTNILYLSDLSFRPAGTDIRVGDTIYNDETQTTSTANTSVTGVTHDLLFQVERGVKVHFPSFLSLGNEIVYSISPPLPTGLSLDTQTGIISGTATYSSPRKEYTLTALNFIGSAKFVFALEARDYFKVENPTTAPTFFLHKVGDAEISRKCRVNAADLLDPTTDFKALDIRCFLDVEEHDLYQIKMKLTESAGPGVCQYVEYAPFSFNQFAPQKSLGVSSRYATVQTVKTGCAIAGVTPTADMCDGNYQYFNADFPNCDEGYLDYVAETWADNGGGCVMTASLPTRVSCGGTKSKCLAGPVKDLLTAAELKLGKRSVIAESSTGYTRTFEHSSPLDNSYLTNLSVANGVINNQCSSTNDHVDSWANKTASIPDYKSPHGSQNPYYEFTCLDSAQEIKARIRVIVRDWNRAFRISDDVDNQSYTAPAAYMNILTADPFGSSYNDRSDWDDDYSGNGSALYTGATVAASCANQTAPGAVCTASLTYIPNATLCGLVNGTWNGGVCELDNEAQCLFYGGTWSGDNDYIFPWDDL